MKLLSKDNIKFKIQTDTTVIEVEGINKKDQIIKDKIAESIELVIRHQVDDAKCKGMIQEKTEDKTEIIRSDVETANSSGSREKDWDLIMDEVKRSFEFTWDSVKTQIDKTSILLGFSVAAILQIALSNEVVIENIDTQTGWITFWLGVISIIASMAIGVYLFDVKRYQIGPEIDDLVSRYEANEDINFKDQINGCINQGKEKLERHSKLFSVLLQIQLYAFIIGVAIVITAIFII